MVREAAVVGFVLLIYGVLGLGPATLLISARPKRVAHVLALAPALGYAIVALLGFPLVRFVAPAPAWSWPVTLALAALSLYLTYRDWRRHREDYVLLRNWSWVASRLGFVLVCAAVLAAPMVQKGITYAAFRSNASDAFTYMGWAEIMQKVDWPTLREGVALTPDNTEGLRNLADASPAALFNARHFVKPLPMSGPAALAWAASLAGTPVYRLHHANNLLAFLIAALVALALGASLEAPGWLKYLAAAVVAVGFWPRFILETDASYQITSIPLFLAFVYAWVTVDQGPVRWWSWQRFILGILGGLLVWFYFPLSLVVAAAAVLYYVPALINRLVPLRTVLMHGLTVVIAVLALTVTGQIDFFARNARYLLLGVEQESTFFSKAMNAFRTESYTLFWGMPRSSLPILGPDTTGPLVQFVTDFYAVFLTVFFFTTVLIVLWRGRDLTERLLLGLIGGGLALMVALSLAGSDKPAGQAFLYVYAFFTLFALLLVKYNRPYFGLLAGRFVPLVVATWLVGQFLLGALLPYTGITQALARTRFLRERDRLDQSAILARLDQEQPKNLLVFAPDDVGWYVGLYAQLLYAPYHPYFAQGLVIDNTADFHNLFLRDLPSEVDYAVVPKKMGGVDYGSLGKQVAETPTFLLYRVGDGNSDYLLDLARSWRDEELTDPPFPTLAP